MAVNDGAAAQGDVFSFGRGTCGQLGLGTTTRHLIPVPLAVLQGRRIARIAAFNSHCIAITGMRSLYCPSYSCACSEKGAVFTWGWGDFGQCGHAKGGNVLEPKELICMEDKVTIAVDVGGQHTGMVTDDGLLYMFGTGSDGQLGHGSDKMMMTPRVVKALSGVSVCQVACGGNFSLALVR